MKVPSSVRELYESQVDLYKLVEDRVKQSLQPVIPATWHYEGRVKAAESFALKVETGRFDPRGLDDFFACTLVVPTLDLIDSAEAIVVGQFEFRVRKPITRSVAQSGPFDFPFDHTRLYARLRVPRGLDPGPINYLTFEVQIKTYLQHAWSIATHDLTYKTNEVSWGKERVAAQVKATLEAAEVSIVEAEKLAKSGNRLLAREDATTVALVSIAGTLQKQFSDAQLPDDVKRLSTTLKVLLEACSLNVASLAAILDRGKKSRGGVHPSDLSPFCVVLQYLVETQPGKLRVALRRVSGPVILVPREVPLPEMFFDKPLPSARFIA